MRKPWGEVENYTPGYPPRITICVDFKCRGGWEESLVEHALRLRFSAQNHIGMNETHAAILEYKGGRWVPAAPVQ